MKGVVIAFVEMAERFSYYGSTAVWTNCKCQIHGYSLHSEIDRSAVIQQPLPAGSKTGAGGEFGQSGALGKGQQTATGLTTFNACVLNGSATDLVLTP